MGGDGLSVDNTDKINVINTNAEIIEEHLHPPIVHTEPCGRHRYGAITFTAIADGDRVRVAGSATVDYYWEDAPPPAPAANEVVITRQGVLKDDVLLLCKAIRGEVDANIQYGAGVGANVDVNAWWTSQRFCVGAIQHAAGQSAFFVDKRDDEPDTVQAINLTTTATLGTLTNMTRCWSTRYNTPAGTAAGVNNRVAGAMQMLIPIGAIPNTIRYDPSIAVVETISSINTVYEMDTYWSLDEITFHEMQHGLNISMNSVQSGSQQFQCQMERPPAGAGIYMKGRSNSGNTESVDLKLQLHGYSPGV